MEKKKSKKTSSKNTSAKNVAAKAFSLQLHDTSIIFSILSCISLFILVAWIFASSGNYLGKFFFHDTMDTGMDFFNSLAEVSNGEPYTKYGTLYPPLANLLFYILHRCVPNKVAVMWPDTHSEIVGMRRTSLDLRTYQAPLLMYVLFFILIIVALIFLIDFILHKHSSCSKSVAFFCVLTYGVLYAIERGNIILLALLFLLVYMAFYQSENKLLSEIALISLAIAAGLKLYPALFGVLLILEKRWKQAIRAVIYGILFFIVPFFVFEGMEAIPIFFNTLFRFSAGGSSSFFGYGLNSIIATFFEGFFVVTGIVCPYQDAITSFIKILFFVILIFCMFRNRSVSERWLIITILSIFIQKAGNYTLIFFLCPFILFLIEQPKVNKANIIFFIFYMLVLLPYPTPIFYANYNIHSLVVIFALLFITGYLLFKEIKIIIQEMNIKANHK